MSESLLIQIWEGLLLLQRKSRMVALLRGFGSEETSPELGYTDGLVLLILEAKPDQTIKELAELLQLERSWVSRVISSLELRKFVKSFIPEADKRSKKVRLTRKGEIALEELTASRYQIAEACLRGLSSSDQEELKEHLKLLADGLKAPGYLARKGSHPVDMELARISWAIGVIGDNYMQSGQNVTQYQVLSSLAANTEGSSSAVELFRFLPFDMSTISRVLAGFEKQGVVSRKVSEQDRRSSAVNLTAKGLAKWKENIRIARGAFQKALSGVSEAKLTRFKNLLGRVTAEMPERPRTVFASRAEVLRISNPDEGKAAKDFLKQTMIVTESAKQLEQFALALDGKLCAAVELERASKDAAIHSITFAGQGLSEKECLKFLYSCLAKVR